MEPPRHDLWDGNRPEKGVNRKIVSEFTTYIRDSIKELAPVDTQTVINIPDLSQYLPDDEDSPEEGFEGQTEPELSRKESFQRQPEVKAVATRKLDRSRRQVKPDSTDPDEGDLDTELAGDGEGSGGASGEGQNGGGGGDGSGGGGEGDGGAGPKRGSEEGLNSKPVIPIRSRVFASNLSQGRYTAVLEPLAKTKADVLLAVKAVADDATSSMIAIESATQQGGKALGTPRSGVIGPVRFGKGKLVIEFTLSEPRKLAMEVVAHEVE